MAKENLYVPEIFWDERALKHGDLGDGYFNSDFQNYEDKIRMKKAFEIIGDISGLRILDVGCGSGRWSIQMAKLGANVTALDISREMIKLAKERAAKSNINNIIFSNEKLEDLNYFNCFDLIIGVTVFQHVTDERRLNLAVANAIKGLKKGGKIIIIESAPIKLGKRVFSENGTSIMKLRPRTEWIALFERNGVKFYQSREICSIGRYLIRFSLKAFKNETIRSIIWRSCEFIDVNLSDKFLFCKFAKPTLFMFKK